MSNRYTICVPFFRASKNSRRYADCSPQPRTWRLVKKTSVILIANALTFAFSCPAHAADTIPATTPVTPVAPANPTPPKSSDADTFNTDLLPGGHRSTLDISRFEHGNPVVPGTYHADVYINNSWVGIMDVLFSTPSGAQNAVPCMDRELLSRANINFSKIPAETLAKLSETNQCLTIDQLIPDGTAVFNSGDLRLDLTVPQLAQNHVPHGYVSPEFWDQGITAATLNYNFNTYNSESQGTSLRTTYLGLDAGINVGDWHLRQSSALNATSGSGPSTHQWQNISTYAQTDLASLGAVLTVGQSYSPSDIFDTIPVIGVQLGTDDRMLPTSMRGYAPTVRGIAETNARVTVRQNNIVIYETTVSPGPFEINDLYSMGYGGDLTVVVTEADGRQRTFIVPFSAVPQLLRPGVTRFDVVAGKLNNTALVNKPNLVQATVQRGVNNIFTAYGGVAAFDGYSEAIVGSAVNLPAGALALDVSAARTEIPQNETSTGESLRMSYSVTIPKTDTYINVAADRYSTSGFFNLSDAATIRDQALQNQASTIEHQRNRFTLSLTQRFGEHGGALYFTGTSQSYWNENSADTQYQLGYSNVYKQLSYNVSVTKTKSSITGASQNQYYIGVSMPLSSDVGHSVNATASLTRNSPGEALSQAAVNGTAGDQNQYSYGVAVAKDDAADTTTGTLNGEYRGSAIKLDATYSRNSVYTQESASASGSIVAHSGGITFGQSLGETVGIIEAPDAAGADILNTNGVKVDSRGFAVVPYLTPYSTNQIEISPKGLPLDVQLDATVQEVAPYAGAVIKMKFKTSNRRTAIIQTNLPDGTSLPFGAQVFDAHDVEVGVVSQGGRVFAKVDNDHGKLSVKWNQDDSARTCTLRYQMPAKKDATADKAYELLTATCLPSGTALAQANQQ